MAALSTLGRYRLREPLGTGAFATAWLGYDDDLDVLVAVKILADNWSHDADVRARFVAEARLLRRVNDQRVVRVHDIGEAPDGRPYFVMDYAEGGTVADLIKAGPVTVDQALRLGAEVAEAVQVLHDHGIMHRDIKPENLLLTGGSGDRPDDGPRHVLVADLGMAKSLSEATGYTVTVGTPAYMAPEQAMGGGFDQRADVYAVAAVTYHLLAGQPPFPGSGVAIIADRDPAARPPSLSLHASPERVSGEQHAPEWADAIDRVLDSSLSFHPDGRPDSARDLARRLDQLRADRRAETVALRQPESSSAPAVRRATAGGGELPVPVAILLALVVAGVTGLVVWGLLSVVR